MTLESLIETYGYPAVLIGTFLEGETILVLAGLAARLGYMDLSSVILAAFIGSVLGDQFYFYLGRWKGPAILARFPTWRERADKVHRWMERYSTLIVFGCRFLYGFRVITPITIGMSRLRAVRFLVVNAASGIVWASVIAGAGYLFGHAVHILLGHIRRYEIYVMGIVITTGLILWTIHRYRSSASRARERRADKVTD